MNPLRPGLLLLLSAIPGLLSCADPQALEDGGARAAAALAEEASVRPGINAPYLAEDLQIETWENRLEAESREIAAQRDDLLAAMGLHVGMEVADIGAGTGLFTTGMAQRVGEEGGVFAVDIVPAFLEHVEAEAGAAGCRNVVTVLCTERSVELEPGSIDLAFICDTYHHFEYPRSTMASLQRALRPGGELFLVDFERIEGVSRAWVLDHVRAGKEVVTAEIEAAGFTLLREYDLLEENYVLRFRRD